MGIKGIYRELGTGKRVSLSKLAADSFDTCGRPLRIAIDVAIWQFQAQAARGGTNPAIRTLFYRLVRLLGTPIQPVFVFDGPHKPAFKRNKRSKSVNGVATAQAKLLIRLFGFAIHDAPGEAEAECAYLQQHGIVDAVLSEDVDTIMFGCTKTLRNWSAESRGSSAPTHVSLYNVSDASMTSLGLDREGMVLVAIMSGGDYLPEGIPGCGVKVACEAARAGFGTSVCRLKTGDTSGIQRWKDSLTQELRSNDSKHFRCKHPGLAIADDFPNLEVLRCYTHPVVSRESALELVREKLEKKQEIDIDSLREFTRETFDWDYRIGAIKFIRVLAPALLIHKIRHEQQGTHGYVKRIHGRRLHWSTDATPELRLSYVPAEVVAVDLSKEVDQEISYDRQGLALNSDDEFDGAAEDKESTEENRPAAVKIFDVTKPDLVWVLENVARQYLPNQVQEWAAVQEAKAAKTAAKTAAKPSSARAKAKASATCKPNMANGALDGFVRVTKASSTRLAAAGKEKNQLPGLDAVHRLCSTLPPVQSSKQALNPIAKGPVESHESPGSSPTAPRPRKPTRVPETIVIPSSPAGLSILVGEPHAPLDGFDSGPVASHAGKTMARPRLEDKQPQALSRQKGSKDRTKTAANKKTAAAKKEKTTLKQTSMNLYTTKVSTPAASLFPAPTRSTAAAASLPDWMNDDASTCSNAEPLRLMRAERPPVRGQQAITAPRRYSPSAPSQPLTSTRPCVTPCAVPLGFFSIESKRRVQGHDETWLANGPGEPEGVLVRTADNCLENVPVIDLTDES